MSLLSPPICLQYTCIFNGPDPLNPTNPNLYWCTFNNIIPQTTGTTVQYDGTSISVGMYCTSNTDGYIFRITRIVSTPVPTAGSVDVIIEDINGFNALIDPLGGLQGGTPATSSIGYVFQINPITKLPILTSINNTPTLTFPDSIVGRFMYEQTSSGGLSFTGPTGSILFFDGNNLTGSSNFIYTTNTGGTATIVIPNLQVNNITLVGTGSSYFGPTGPTGPSGTGGSLSFTGPTGSILFFNGNNLTGSSNFIYTTNTGGTATIVIPNLQVNNITLVGTGSSYFGSTGPTGSNGLTGSTGPAGNTSGYITTNLNNNNTFNTSLSLTTTNFNSTIGSWNSLPINTKQLQLTFNNSYTPTKIPLFNTGIYIYDDGLIEQNLATPNSNIILNGTLTLGGGTLYAITYGNGLYVAVGTNGSGNQQIRTSSDAITWTSITTGATGILRAITYGNGLYVAVGNSGTNQQIYTSSDAITWTLRTTGLGTGGVTYATLRGITYGNGLYVAVGDSSGSGINVQVYTSSDAITWTLRTTGLTQSGLLNGIIYANGLFVIVGFSVRIYTSSDAITWTPISGLGGGSLNAITYANGLYVAAGSDSSSNQQIYTSSNAITWTLRTTGLANNGNLYGITYANGLYFAAGILTGIQIYSSSDAITWTLITPGLISGGAYGITYGNGLLLIPGYSGSNQQIYNIASYKYPIKLNLVNSKWILTYTHLYTGTIETNPNGQNFYLYLNMLN